MTDEIRKVIADAADLSESMGNEVANDIITALHAAGYEIERKGTRVALKRALAALKDIGTVGEESRLILIGEDEFVPLSQVIEEVEHAMGESTDDK